MGISKTLDDGLGEGAFVLNKHSPDNIAEMMIEKGHQNEPFFIFDMDESYAHIQRFREKLPRVQIFYATKANDYPLMLKLAIATGLGFDCASPGEISKIMQLNVLPTSIIYAVTMKTPDQMIYARQAGIRHTTFDSSNELVKLKKFWPDARLLIRLRIESDSVYKLGEKFGCDFKTEAVPLLEEAASLGLRVIGVAFHVGSACSSPESYNVGLQQSKELFQHEANAGRKMEIVNIGGGFFSDYPERFDMVSELITGTLEELFPDPNVQVIAEPGRYLCETAFTLYTNIKDIQRTKVNDMTLNKLFLNEGIHGTLRSYEKWHVIRKLKDVSNSHEIEDTVLYGPTCESKDVIIKIKLPRCTTDDWLVFETQGSYTVTFGTKYSSFPLIRTRTIISLELWNELKNNAVFQPSDFVTDSDPATALPLTLPPVLPENIDSLILSE